MLRALLGEGEGGIRDRFGQPLEEWNSLSSRREVGEERGSV